MHTKRVRYNIDNIVVIIFTAAFIPYKHGTRTREHKHAFWTNQVQNNDVVDKSLCTPSRI